AGVDRQKVVVALQELADPVLVLRADDRAGHVDDTPATLDETQSIFKRFILILDALIERARADAPLGVGVAPPGAGAGARRVDHDQIAPPFEVREDLFRPAGRADLDIARARSDEPGDDRREA